MARKSILDRYDQLEARGDELAERAATSTAPAITSVHVKTVEVMGELLNLAQGSVRRDTPAHLKMLTNTISRLRPMLAENIAVIPADKLQEFMAGIEAKIHSITSIELRKDGEHATEAAAPVDRGSVTPST